MRRFGAPCAVAIATCLVGLLIGSPSIGYIRNVDYGGQTYQELVIPPSPPPPGYVPTAEPEPVPNPTQGVNILSNVPAFDWCYGCSPTSAGMIMGYYDRLNYTKMYTGPANGGVCPMDNSVWGSGECPIVASHMGIDGRNNRGHVDDYWIASGNCSNDPYITGGWAQHSPPDCTADFMGTSQTAWGECDGYTVFCFNGGNKVYDWTGWEPARRDGTHGMRLYAESKGYTVVENYNQGITTGTSGGFTFADFMAEIDAGRPVLIQLTGHTMVGYGYDSSNQTIYIRNTWDRYAHTMTWGGTYSGMSHVGVSVLRLAPTVVETPAFSPAPGVHPGPIAVTITCATPGATIHYTTTGATPTESDPVIANGGTVIIDKISYLKAMATKAGMTNSAIRSGIYGPQAAAPSLSPSGGAYEAGTIVTVSTTTAGAEIRYTTSGAEPTTSDPVAAGQIVLAHSCTLKAKAFKTDWVASQTTTGSYTVYETMNVSSTKLQPDNAAVSCRNGIISLVLPDAFFIESEDRVTGIRVDMPGHGFTVGTRLNVMGTLVTVGGERRINAAYACVTGTGNISPIYVNCRDLGGISWFYDSTTGAGQQGLPNARGPNNIGLLVRTSGALSPIDSSRFLLTDGTGCGVECVVPDGVIIDPSWRFVSVTGVSGCQSVGGGAIKRVLWIGSQDDIVSLGGATICGKVATPNGSQIVSRTIESPHPYPSNCTTTWTFTGPVGTKRIRAHFVQMELEYFYDRILVQDANGTLVQGFMLSSPKYDVWSNWVTGSVLKIQLTSNATNNFYGFAVDRFECDCTAVGIAGATVTLSPAGRTFTTRGDGSYRFDGLAAGDYILTASAPGVSFTPPSLPVSVFANQRLTGVDFAGSSAYGSIGGRVAQDAILTGTANVECPHPYPASYTNTWILNAPPDALKLRAHFSTIELETGRDYLYVKDASGATKQTFDTGALTNDVWTDWVTGNTMQFTLATDATNCRYGFAVDKYQYELMTPIGGVTVSVSPGMLSTVTASDGSFVFHGLADGTYTVTPTLASMTFNPACRTVAINGAGHQAGVDFVRN